MVNYIDKLIQYSQESNHKLYGYGGDINNRVSAKQFLINRFKDKNIDDSNIKDFWSKSFIFNNRIDKYTKEQSFDKILKDGGNLGLSNEDESFTEINNGGTHEQNPYGGIPMGIYDSHTNKVEEGETKVKLTGRDYIFSNRLKL